VETPRLLVDRDIAKENSSLQALFGISEDVFSSNIVSDFLNTHSDANEIEVEIRCDGGSTSETKVCYDLLKNSGKRIVTKGYKVNSSAVVLFLAGDERLITQNADFVIHPVWIDPNGLPLKMEAEDLIDFGNEMKAEEERLLNIYCSVIGEDKREEVKNLMSKSTNLSADDAIRLGFATGKLEEQGSHSENNRAVSFSNHMADLILNKQKSNQNQEDMKGLKETLDNINKTLKSFVNKTDEETTAETQNNETEVQNASVELSEGGSLYYDGDLAEGVAVFTDETMETAAPDGDHALADGRVVSVSEGVVSAVAAASSEDEDPENKDDNDTQNTEVEELKNKLEAVEATQAEQTEALNNIAESLKNIAPAFDALKNLVPGDTGGDATPQNRTIKRTEDKTVAEMTNLEKKRYNQTK
jgi:ATP-dependent protease ClpP protease subunit